MDTEVTLNVKEQKRLKVLNQLEFGQITATIGAGSSCRNRSQRALRKADSD